MKNEKVKEKKVKMTQTELVLLFSLFFCIKEELL
jgi:hypothetical protein